MDQSQIASVYDSIHDWDAPHMPVNDPQFAYLLRHLPAHHDARILDAGCGSGVYATELARRGYQDITAVDLFEELKTGGRFTYQQGSIDQLDASDSTFDFVYCWSVIYYLEDARTGIEELFRVMRPGATLLLSSHTKYSLFTLERKVLRSIGKAPHLKGVEFPRTGRLVRQMETAGFQILDVDGYRLLWLPQMLQRQWARAARYAASRRRQAPTAQVRQSPKWLKRFRSVFAYHFVVTARKPA